MIRIHSILSLSLLLLALVFTTVVSTSAIASIYDLSISKLEHNQGEPSSGHESLFDNLEEEKEKESDEYEELCIMDTSGYYLVALKGSSNLFMPGFSQPGSSPVFKVPIV